jgi:hypothetical protein
LRMGRTESSKLSGPGQLPSHATVMWAGK